MRNVTIALSDLLVLRNLRSVLGVGVGLLLASRLTETQRKAAGWATLLSAVAVGIPFAVGFLGKLRSKEPEARRAPTGASARAPLGATAESRL